MHRTDDDHDDNQKHRHSETPLVLSLLKRNSECLNDVFPVEEVSQHAFFGRFQSLLLVDLELRLFDIENSIEQRDTVERGWYRKNSVKANQSGARKSFYRNDDQISSSTNEWHFNSANDSQAIVTVSLSRLLLYFYRKRVIKFCHILLFSVARELHSNKSTDCVELHHSL